MRTIISETLVEWDDKDKMANPQERRIYYGE